VTDKLQFRPEDFASIAISDRFWKDAARIAQAKFDAWLNERSLVIQDSCGVRWIPVGRNWTKQKHTRSFRVARLVWVEENKP
jgi:hypothetical protein